MEDFDNQPNGICLECWDKTLVFDQFYKSVQAAHLLLLNSKYKNPEVEKVVIKCENIESDDVLSTDDLTPENSTCDYGISDQENDQNSVENGNTNGKHCFPINL